MTGFCLPLVAGSLRHACETAGIDVLHDGNGSLENTEGAVLLELVGIRGLTLPRRTGEEPQIVILPCDEYKLLAVLQVLGGLRTQALGSLLFGASDRYQH